MAGDGIGSGAARSSAEGLLALCQPALSCCCRLVPRRWAGAWNAAGLCAPGGFQSKGLELWALAHPAHSGFGSQVLGWGSSFCRPPYGPSFTSHLSLPWPPSCLLLGSSCCT